MTRLELLKFSVARARINGFNFRRWYTTRLALPWISNEAALQLLDAQRRYYVLLFSHEFASAFWKAGEEITFSVPPQTFSRILPDGTVQQVTRKPYIRRSSRPDVWRYHLREMAVAEEPSRYLRKYLHTDDELEPDPETAAKAARGPGGNARTRSTRRLPMKTAAKVISPRSLPPGLPNFLKRPYNGSSA